MKKKLLIFVLALIVCLSFASCFEASNVSNDTTDTSLETADPNAEEKQLIKEELMKILNDDEASEEMESPIDLFDSFIGDYQITEFPEKSWYGSSVKSVWQKDGVTVIEYRDGHKEYSLVKDIYHFLFTANGDTYELESVQYVDEGHVPSIYDDFGISIGGLYGESEKTILPPVLKEDMIVVSDDLVTCTFTSEYLDELVKWFSRSMDVSVIDSKDWKCNGSYDVEGKKVKFEITGNTEETGDFKMEISFSDKSGEMTMSLECSPVTDGAVVPMTTEMTIKDVVYDGSKAQSATIDYKIDIKNAEVIVEDVKYSMDSTTISCFYFNLATNSMSATTNSKVVVSNNGQKQKQSSQVTLSVVGGTFKCDMKSGGSSSTINGEGVVFGTPEGKEIPQIVYDLTEKAYDQIIHQ